VAATEQTLLQLSEKIQRAGHRYPEPERCHRAYRLLSRTDLPLEDELAQSDEWIAADRGSAEPYIRTLWLMVLCVYGRHDLAFAQSEKLGKRLFKITPYVHVADHMFYRGMAAAALARSGPWVERYRFMQQLGRCLRPLRRWAKAGPDFAHMALLEAERAHLRGNRARARKLYEEAASAAHQQDFVHHAALAHERLGRALLEERRETEAAGALREAIAFYKTWGARPKAQALAAEHRKLIL
jgi:tetratricopeptide (TPR) repeat protein